MTELFILGKIIWDWRASLSGYQKFRFRRPYRFLFAADIWVFINLVLALVISVPAFNLFTHGTHVIVAHTMGATIGINTMILLGRPILSSNSAPPITPGTQLRGWWNRATGSPTLRC